MLHIHSGLQHTIAVRHHWQMHDHHVPFGEVLTPFVDVFQPSRKRSAGSLAEDTTTVKRLRQGLGSQQQFLTVFQTRPSTKQR